MTYGQILDAFTEVLYRYDPQKLAPMGAPKDEYVHEATRILAWLNDQETVTEETLLDAVHRIFVGAFDLKIAGPSEWYVEATREMYALWTAR